MKIGVFDSGIGGKAVTRDIEIAFPDAEILYLNDRKHVPYGSKSPAEIRALTDVAIQPLIAQTCDVIVIACNTATAVAITELRAAYPSQLFIGLEPMLKPAAALTKTGVVAICATPATLSSVLYQNAKLKFAEDITLLEPDCHDWAEKIEQNRTNEIAIETVISDCLEKSADVIVLGCTHYHWIRQEIEKICAGHAAILDPTDAIIRRIRALVPPR